MTDAGGPYVGYDRGGTLPSGPVRVMNDTGQPEPVIPATPDLAALIASLDDETSLVAMSALDQLWSDKHSCESEECWGYRGYPPDWFRRMLEAAIEAVGKDRPSLIDLGAGIGTKCLFARRMGCEAWGVEHNPHYVVAARRFGADVAEGDVRDADVSRFDIVFANAPLRDVAQQAALEAKVAHHMKPGSVLMLGNRAGPAPTGWKQLTTVIERDGAWLKPA